MIMIVFKHAPSDFSLIIPPRDPIPILNSDVVLLLLSYHSIHTMNKTTYN